MGEVLLQASTLRAVAAGDANDTLVHVHVSSSAHTHMRHVLHNLSNCKLGVHMHATACLPHCRPSGADVYSSAFESACPQHSQAAARLPTQGRQAVSEQAQLQHGLPPQGGPPGGQPRRALAVGHHAVQPVHRLQLRRPQRLHRLQQHTLPLRQRTQKALPMPIQTARQHQRHQLIAGGHPSCPETT